MSLFRDPELFLVWGRTMGLQFYIARLKIKIGCPIVAQDFTHLELLRFSKHLSLEHNKESDFETFFAYLRRNDKFVNCQGLVVDWVSHNPQHTSFSYSWSHELLNLPSYGIHALVSRREREYAAKLDACLNERHREKGEKHALEKRLSDLHVQLNREKNDKEALERRVSDLHVQLNQCCGAPDGLTDENPWMSNNAVPGNWVPFEELDVQTFPRNTPLAFTKAMGRPVLSVDNTTNVQANHFYRGVFPIVVVNVDKLVPDKENARFDPDIWGLFQNEGTSYAARKPFESEM